jgi:voltage-gated potassium channel
MRNPIRKILDDAVGVGALPRGRLELVALALAGWVALGALGYMVIEDWSYLDSGYMAVIGITTVGFTEVHPLSAARRGFTVFYLAVNLVLMIVAGSAITSYLLEGHVGGALRRQRLEHQLAKLSNHVILCGFGRMGCAAAQELRRSGVPLVVIENRPDVIAYAKEQGFLHYEGSAFDEEVLRRVGLDRARGVIAALGSDADNLTLTLTIRDMQGDIPIVGRATGDTERRLMRRAGATHIISPYEAGGVRMAAMISRPEVVQFLDVTMMAGDRAIRLESITVAAEAPVAGKVLRETHCFAESGTIVVGLVEPDGTVTVNPPRGSTLAPGATIIVLGDEDQLAHLHRLLKPGGAGQAARQV